MSAIATVYGGEERPVSLALGRRPSVMVLDWRQCVASCLIAACITIPDATLQAKWSRLSLVTGLAFHRYVAPTS